MYSIQFKSVTNILAQFSSWVILTNGYGDPRRSKTFSLPNMQSWKLLMKNILIVKTAMILGSDQTVQTVKAVSPDVWLFDSAPAG